VSGETRYAKSGDINIAYQKDLVAGSGLEFEHRGKHVLKGIPGEWQLYAAMP